MKTFKTFCYFHSNRLQPTSNLWNGSSRLRKQLSRLVSKLFSQVITVLFLWFPIFFLTTQVTDLMLLMEAVVALMGALWDQVFILFRLFQVHILQRQTLAMQCHHPPNTCHRMTNCSQRTGECLEEI